MGADDAARAPRTVDDHLGGRVRCQLGHAQYQLGTRHADAAGDAHGLVLVEAAGVEHHHIGLGIEQCLYLLGRERRRVPLAFDQLAEGLAGHVDVAEQLATGCAPAGEAALKQCHIAVPQRRQALASQGSQPFAVVIQSNGSVAPRYPGEDLQLQLRQRDVGRKQRVLLGERIFLADIDQRQFFMGQQRPANVLEGTGGDSTHGAGFSLDRSQMLGRRVLE
ncbi:hypothetical protein D3C81_909830 [compost metagenome]